MKRVFPFAILVLGSLLLALCAAPAPVVSYRVSTVAGSGPTGPLAGGYADGPASRARFHDPMALAVAADGTLYVSDTRNHRIRAVTPDGSVSTVAGSGPAGPEGGFADGPAASARFFEPEGLTVDSAGNIIVADTLNDRIRRISPDGHVTTVAGLGLASRYGVNAPLVDGPVTQATFNDPSDVAVDAAGNLYVTDRLNHVIRKITPDGMVSTFAGCGLPGGADGIGTQAAFELPNRIAIDRMGVLYVTEGRFLDFGERTYGFRVRKITPEGRVSTLAGTGEPGYRDGPGGAAQFDVVIGIAVDDEGNVYVAETGGHRIRRISPAGVVTTVAGSGTAGYADGPAAAAAFWYPTDLAIGPSGELYVADWKNQRIRVIVPSKRPGQVASGSAGVSLTPGLPAPRSARPRHATP
jgi:sugar lactone lactonase YvrE